MYQKLNSPKSYRGIFIFFILVTLALVAFVFYTSFSQAIVTIFPKKDKIILDFEIKIEKNQDLEKEPKILAGRVLQITQSIDEKITDFPKTKMRERARGRVTIINNLDEPQGIVAKTQLKHQGSGLIFRTDEAINIPKKGRVDVSVTADKTGAEGEVEPGKFTLIKLSDEMQKMIYAESEEKFKIVSEEKKIATAEIMEKEKQKIVDDMTQSGLEKLKEKLSPGEKINEAAIKKEILKSAASVEPETETEEFSISVTLKLSALIFDEKKLFDIAEEKLRQKASKEQEFLKTSFENFKYEIESQNQETGQAKVKVHAEAEALSKLEAEEIDKEKLLGRSEEEVKMYFRNDPRIERVEVLFAPFWTKRVPTLKDHIEIVIKK